MARIVIEVPEEMAALIERDPLLRLAAAEAVKKKEVAEYLLTVMALDKLTENSRLGEKDVLEIGRLVKRAVREKWDAEDSSRHK